MPRASFRPATVTPHKGALAKSRAANPLTGFCRIRCKDPSRRLAWAACPGEYASMATPALIYRRTEAGRKAWDTQNTGVPLEYRRVLGAIEADVHCDSLRATLGRYSEAELFELLAELELRGLIESQEDVAENDLDFTRSFNVADLRAAQNK